MLNPINGEKGFIRTRLMISSHPQWVSTLNRQLSKFLKL